MALLHECHTCKWRIMYIRTLLHDCSTSNPSPIRLATLYVACQTAISAMNKHTVQAWFSNKKGDESVFGEHPT